MSNTWWIFVICRHSSKPLVLIISFNVSASFALHMLLSPSLSPSSSFFYYLLVFSLSIFSFSFFLLLFLPFSSCFVHSEMLVWEIHCSFPSFAAQLISSCILPLRPARAVNHSPCASCRPSGPRNCSMFLPYSVLSRGKFVCCQVNVSDSHVSWIHVR